MQWLAEGHKHGGSGELGRKDFSIPKQAALLLQQAFEAMKESSVRFKHGTTIDGEDKGKAVIEQVDQVEKLPKPPLTIEGLESSKQGDIRGGGGIAKLHAIIGAK
jgi:hypothetical protein